MNLKVISGAQTGVDRAALDAAIHSGLEHGGCVPKGRRAEDGKVPAHYQVWECESAEYPVRTELNIQNSDATLILCRGPLERGTQLTRWLAIKRQKPYCVVDVGRLPPEQAASEVTQFIRRKSSKILNVAGPRESQSPGIYSATYKILREAFQRLHSYSSPSPLGRG